MADPITPEGTDPFIEAGELALGVLEGGELAAARQRQLTDPAFAAAVDWWEMRLSAIAEGTGELAPSASVWRGIEAAIDRDSAAGAAPVPIARATRGPAPWSIAAAMGGAAMAAVALALFFARPANLPPTVPPIVEARGPQLVAQLQDEQAGRKLAGVIDPENRKLALNIAGLEAAAGQAPELWVIPAGGAPVSLGYIPQDGEFSRDLSSEEAALLAEGATLAVTFEEATGVRHEAPSPPILLAGSLDKV